MANEPAVARYRDRAHEKVVAHLKGLGLFGHNVEVAVPEWSNTESHDSILFYLTYENRLFRRGATLPVALLTGDGKLRSLIDPRFVFDFKEPIDTKGIA